MTFTLRPLTPADFPRMVEIQRAQLPEPNTVEELNRAEQKRPPGEIRRRVAAVTPDGLLIGYGGIGRSNLSRPGYMSINIRVDRAWRGQGVGSAIYADLMRFASEHGTAALDSDVREDAPEGRLFAEHRGFTCRSHGFASKLNPVEFDPAPWLDSIRVAEASGIRFTTLAEYAQTDETWDRFIDCFVQLVRDSPGQADFPRPATADFRETLESGPNWNPADAVLAVDGDQWAAMAWAMREPDGSHYHNITGVAPAYRGRGLATAIKVALILHLQAKGVTKVFTHNDSTNERMLAVNRKMGYVPEPGVFHMERAL